MARALRTPWRPTWPPKGSSSILRGSVGSPMTRASSLVDLPAEWPTGMAITGYVPMGTREAVVIPGDAVIRRGQLTGVELATESGVILRWVRLGRTVGDQVEVLSGLDADDRIVR